MEDKSYQEAIEARTQSLTEDLARLARESVDTYLEGLGTSHGQTFQQITNHIENTAIRKMVYGMCLHIYLTILVKTNQDRDITNQAQTDELNEYLNLAENLISKADREQ